MLETADIKEPETNYPQMANAIRVLAMDAVEKAKSGHPGMPMGMADVATVLFADFLKFDPQAPNWPNRDRFVLSAGHGSMLIYALLYLTGYKDITIEDLKNFRQLGAKTAGHPEYGHAPGIETTTGPLGQGIANAVGMALAERMQNARDGVTDHHTYCIAGDGCLMEGISQEAISLAGHLKLNKLIVLWDDNKISIDGATSLATSENQLKRFQAAGWATKSINGHNIKAIKEALAWAKTQSEPVMIACKTRIGHGAPTKAGTHGSHGSPLGAEEILGARKYLKWTHAEFELPENILAAWRAVGQKHKADSQKQNLTLPHLSKLLEPLKKEFAEKKPGMATRNSSNKVLDVLTEALPQLIGGSADLTGSVGTKTKNYKAITAENYSGNYIHYGVREHAMQAVMNGLTLHGEFIPYAGTFLVFTDYCRPAIRLAALMGIRTILVGTHDSIGLGEDGPTHQPVEHLASLRAIPNLMVFRPCDEIEVAEAWELAIAAEKTPSVISLTRQNVPTLRSDYSENKSARGGYIISEIQKPDVTLIATGSEVAIALEAQKKLAEIDINSSVVSMPCTRLFDLQPKIYRDKVLGSGLKVAIEAAGGYGWERYIGSDGIFVGMTGFGASGPYQELYKHFGITVENVVEQIEKRLSQ